MMSFAAMHTCVILFFLVSILLFHIDNCQLVCQNSGTLINGDTACVCPPAYTGTDCSTVVTICEMDELLSHIDDWGGSYSASSGVGSDVNGNVVGGRWQPTAGDPRPYVQINLGLEMMISRLDMAGGGGASYVANYWLTFLGEIGTGDRWYPVLHNMATDTDFNSGIVVFNGTTSTDATIFVPQRFCPRIRTSALRIYPTTVVGGPAQMRVKMYGCPPGFGCSYCTKVTTECWCPLGYVTNYTLDDGVNPYEHCDMWVMPPIDCEDIATYHPDCVDTYLTGDNNIYPMNQSNVYTTDIYTYCEMDLLGGGWTVFHKRMDASLDFFAEWYDYNDGFGDGTLNLAVINYWMQNDYIHLLTMNSFHDYTMVVYLKATDQQEGMAYYDSFKVDAEFNDFTLHLGNFVCGNLGDSLSSQNGMRFSTYDSQTSGNCTGRCHGAWWYGGGNCTMSNLNGRFGSTSGTCDANMWYTFRQNQPMVSSLMMIRRAPLGVVMPDKRPSYPYPVDCYDIQSRDPGAGSGIYTIYPVNSVASVSVYCEMAVLDGGWTVIQKQSSDQYWIDFNKNWVDFENGFSDPTDGIYYNHYLGNRAIYMLTNYLYHGIQYELAVVMEATTGDMKTATYSLFYLTDNIDYRIQVSGFNARGFADSGGDSLTASNGRPFQTPDNAYGETCATIRNGGWWYQIPANGNASFPNCADANLNGDPTTNVWEMGMYWSSWTGRKLSLKTAMMMIRPKYKKPIDCKDIYDRTSTASSGSYWIFPYGMRPIQTYCNFEMGGATVIQLRQANNQNFSNSWANYKAGFSGGGGAGVPDFWIGNDNLHQMTTNIGYSLGIRVQNAVTGTIYEGIYDDFKVASEANGYMLLVGNYQTQSSNDAGDSLSAHNYAKFSTYDFSPSGTNCGQTSGWWLPSSCSILANLNNKLNLASSSDAVSWTTAIASAFAINYTMMYIVRKTSVAELLYTDISTFCSNPLVVKYECEHPYQATSGDTTARTRLSDVTGAWTGTDLTCAPYAVPNDCSYQQSIATYSKFYELTMTFPPMVVPVRCDMTTFGGGWTIIQRHSNDGVNFNRTLSAYKDGFGNSTATGTSSFWIGLGYINQLTKAATYELLVEIWTSNTYVYALYGDFYIDSVNYGLHISGFESCSTAGDSLSALNGMAFTVDTSGAGGWWAPQSNDITNAYSNLNGLFSGSPTRKIFWSSYQGGATPTLVSMKIRRAGVHGWYQQAYGLNCAMGASISLSGFATAQGCLDACTNYTGFTCKVAVYDRSSSCVMHDLHCNPGQGTLTYTEDSYFRMDSCGMFSTSCGPPPTMRNAYLNILSADFATSLTLLYQCYYSPYYQNRLGTNITSGLICNQTSHEWIGALMDCYGPCGDLFPDLSSYNATGNGTITAVGGTYTVYYSCMPGYFWASGDLTQVCAAPYSGFTSTSTPHCCQNGQTCIDCVNIGGCSNGGTCIGLNNCSCAAGWTGTNCSAVAISCSPACSVHGNCTAMNMCTCEAQYTDPQCATPICSPQCVNGGTCTAPNTCTCTAGWTGSICATPICASACVNGNCTAPNTCSCSAGYTGNTCNAPVCASPCINGGTCTAPNVCSCTAGYNGNTCNTPICVSACVNGNCTAPNTCSCSAGYTGSTCNTPICTSPCMNGGTCSAPNVCSCGAGYTGSTCNTPICVSACVNGNCTAPNTCSCSAGYTGSTCNTPICTSPCMNGGTCSAPNVCSCGAGYTGSTCNTPICVSACVNGNCTAPNTCSCSVGYTGSTCNTPICASTCLNGGTCTAPNVCTCTASYNGNTCNTPICVSACVHGNCTAPNICTCAVGWTGSTCATPVCSPACSNNGTCTSPNTCTCPAGWTGSTCTTAICTISCAQGESCVAPDTCLKCPSGWSGINCTTAVCVQTCANGGSCTSPDNCTCAAGWTGNNCTTAVCLSACMHGGTCIGPNTCNCSSGWTGFNCSTPTCTSTCMNGGSCSAPDTCQCAPGWQGSLCNTPICSTPCQNGGNCTSPNTCSCTTQWTGATCSTPVCSPVCANGGSCSSPGSCNCATGYTGSDCSAAVCNPVCLNGGSCTLAKTCSCASGWQGSSCSTPVCSPSCKNGGTCSSPNTCQCPSGWMDSTCSTYNCASRGECNNNGQCTGSNICSCNKGWLAPDCLSPDCNSIGDCLNGGSCTDPDTCTCLDGWLGDNCNIADCSTIGGCSNNATCVTANGCKCLDGWMGNTCSEPVPATPTSMNFLSTLNAPSIQANAETISSMAVSFAASVTSTKDSTKVASGTLDMVTNLAPTMNIFADLADSGSLPPKTVTSVINDFSILTDSLLSVAANQSNVQSAIAVTTTSTSASASDSVATSTGASARCSASIASLQENSQSTLKNAVVLSSSELATLYSSFTQIVQAMVAMVKTVLKSGEDFTYNGKFYNVIVRKMSLASLRGRQFNANLTYVSFLSPGDSTHLLHSTDVNSFQLSADSQVNVVVTAYINNVLNVSQPFNMPTVSVKVYYHGSLLTLNASNPITVVARPVAIKAALYSTEKVTAQCDVSKIKCDLTTNADTLGSLATLPVNLTTGDYLLTFPATSYNYLAFLCFDSTPTTNSYTWQLSVSGNSGATVTVGEKSGALVTLKTNFNSNKELGVLIPKKALSAAVSCSTSSSASSKSDTRTLYVFMKKQFSSYSSLDDLPGDACQLQHCFGNHISVGFAITSNSKAERRKRDTYDTSGNSTADFQVEPSSNESAIVFKSSYFGDFGANLVIPPNTIQFSDIFANFSTLVADNSAVLAFMVVAIVVFLLGIVATIRFDKQDLKAWAFLPLLSNKPGQTFKYLISVSYNGVKNFNLVPQVYVRLIGNIHDTQWRLLDDGIRKENFDGARPANFTLTSYLTVGRMEKVEIRLGSKVQSKGHPLKFHLDKVIVVDVFNSRKYMFPAKCNLEAGQTKSISLATEDEIKGFRYLISRHSRVGITDNHPWLSIAQRPLPSHWTRCERLGCVISALFLAMLVNAMFYGKGSASPRIGINIGGYLRISWFTVWTSLVGAIIVVPPATIMGFIFKKVRRKSAEDSEWTTIFNVKTEKKTEEAVEEDDCDDESSDKKKPFLLPHKCVIIAWTLVGACIGVSAFFIVMYSLSWGREKSLQWLVGIIMHIVQDIIIIQSIKVLIFSVFSSTLLSLPDDGMGVGTMIYSKNNSNYKTQMFSRLRNIMAAAVHQILYVIAFAVVIATTQNTYSYIQVKAIRPLCAVNNTAQLTDTIIDHSAVFDWLNKTMLPNFLNGNQLVYGGIFTRKNMYVVPNHDFVLIGPIRMRQQRFLTGPCPLSVSVVKSRVQRYVDPLTNSTRCIDPVTNFLDFPELPDKRTFNYSWDLANLVEAYSDTSTLSLSQVPWTFRNAEGLSYSGWQASYGTGGYYVDLPTKLADARNVVKKLRASRWLDNATSVLFVEFVLYNAQVNVFISGKVVFESLGTGGMSYHMRLIPVLLYQYSGSNAILVLAVQAIWIIVLLSHVFTISRQIYKTGFNTFRKDGWNLFDIAQVLLCLAIVAIFAGRIYNVIDKVTEMQTKKSSFVNIDLQATWEELMANLYGIAFFMTMMLCFRHLASNKYWAIFLGTFSRGKGDIFTYVTMFTIITFIFASLGYISLGTTVNEFRSYHESVFTLIQNIIGVSGPLMSLGMSSRFILIFCLAYSTIVMFLAVQIFMAIINVTYGFISSNVETHTKWDKDLANYMSTEWKGLFSKNADAIKQEPGFEPIGEKTCADLEKAVHQLARLLNQSVDDSDRDDRRIIRLTVEEMKELPQRVLRASKAPSALPYSLAGLPVKTSGLPLGDVRSGYGLRRDSVALNPHLDHDELI